MDILNAIILGIVQGLTEFLPVSSSGHLVLLQKIFGINEPTLFFDTMLHMGTLLAVFVVLRKEIWAILRRPVQPLTGWLILATVPTVIVALVFKDTIEHIFETGRFLGASFLITTVLLVVAELLSRRAGTDNGLRKAEDMNWLDALIIGVLQAVAIAPGISRSGATISGALSRRLDRDFAARFSFLMSIPAILGALVLQTKDLVKGGTADGASASGIGATAVIAGTLIAAVVGFFAVRFMLKIIKERSLFGFAAYTAVLGILILSGLTTTCESGTKGSESGNIETLEKITVAGGALPVYKFTLPEGAVFRDYAGITGQFLFDGENYDKTARVRAYGNYPAGLFLHENDLVFLDFSSGETDRNAPYLVSNVFGSNIAVDTVSGGSGPNTWFTLDFPLDGNRHQNYNPENFPDDNAGGDFYFALGPGTADTNAVLTYYVKDIALVSADGTRKVFAKGSGFDRPAFAGYPTALAELGREQVSAVGKEIPTKEKGGPAAITVDTTVRYQQVRGFGGMSNAWNSPILNEDEITTMYGENGLGYNIFRIIIYHDPALWGELLPVVKKVQGYGAEILASPWTPPLEFKSVNSNVGGHLLPEHYADYAAHLRSFVRYMADNGVKIDAVSFQNEPDIKVSYDSCDWTPEQMLEFVKSYGREIGDVKIIPGESFQFKRNLTDPVLNDPEALNNFDIIGGHIYGGGLEPYPLAAEKGKEVWMTEHLMNTPGNYPGDLTWKSAMAVAKEIHDCMTADFNAYIWWYLKRFYSMIGDGENGANEGRVLNRGYVMSHYAKYATGKQRVEALVNGNPNVFTSAYDGGGNLSLVIVNTGTKPSKVTIRLPSKVTRISAEVSDEGGVMQTKSVRTGFGGKTASLTLGPQSIVSVRVE